LANRGTLHARVINLHDVESNWNKTTGFIPRPGEIIVYDPDLLHPYSRIKIGDGCTDIKELSFISDTVSSIILNSFFDKTVDDVVYLDAGSITEYD